MVTVVPNFEDENTDEDDDTQIVSDSSRKGVRRERVEVAGRKKKQGRVEEVGDTATESEDSEDEAQVKQPFL